MMGIGATPPATTRISVSFKVLIAILLVKLKVRMSVLKILRVKSWLPTLAFETATQFKNVKVGLRDCKTVGVST